MFLNWSPSDRRDIFTSLFCFGKLVQLCFVREFDTERSPLLRMFTLHTPNVRILFSKCWTTYLTRLYDRALAHSLVNH